MVRDSHTLTGPDPHDPEARLEPTLTTPRLILRRWREADLEPFARLNADPDVMRFFSRPLDRAASDAFVGLIEAQFDRRGYGLWALDWLRDHRPEGDRVTDIRGA